MAKTASRTIPHLRLVRRSSPELPPVLVSSAARKQFEELTQRLLDVVIEIGDLIDGDCDIELTFEDYEEDDGV